MTYLNKILLAFIACCGLLVASCSNNSTGSKTKSSPSIKLSKSSVSLAQGTSTTVDISVTAAGGFNKVSASATSGQVTVNNVKGQNSKSGSATLNYTAPQTNGSYSVTVMVTDNNNQTGKSTLSVNVGKSSGNTKVYNKGDKISGTWKTGQNVMINGSVVVPKDKSLTIMPGVHVIMKGSGTSSAPDITVRGSFYSYGTANKPVTFNVPKSKRTKANMFEGLWGGILGTESSPAMVLEYTHLAYMGAPAGANDPIVLSGEEDEGDPRYGLFYDNIKGKFVMTHCYFANTPDDGMRVRGGKMLLTYNTFSQTGSTGGESVNVKSGVTGIMAYNLAFESSTNGLKWSNEGNTDVQTNVDVYNNTVINSGWRRVKIGRGGSIDIKTGARGKIYNNLLADNKYSVRLVPAPDNPDTVNVSVGYNLMYGNNKRMKDNFYPQNGTLVKGEYETSHDVVGGVGDNNPQFVNFDVTKYDSTEAQDTHPLFDSSWDFHLKSGSPALNAGKTNFTPVISSITVNGKTYKAPAPSSYIGAYGTK